MKTIGDYKLIRQIDEGGMGAIFLASHLKTRRQVAIKVIRTALTLDNHMTQRFEREINISKQFAHPYVIKILDGGFVEEKNIFFLVMEYLKGQPLNKAFSENTASSKEASLIMSHCAEALSYIHKRGIIHRDIKPHNILIISPDRSVLLDFGLALADDLTRLSRTSDKPGTFTTMAPEQLLGEQIDNRADIYSLGCTIYKILTGVTPYNRNQITCIAAGRKVPLPITPAKINRDISLKLSGIIMTCLALNKDDRYSSANELINALQKKETTPAALKPDFSPTPIRSAIDGGSQSATDKTSQSVTDEASQSVTDEASQHNSTSKSTSSNSSRSVRKRIALLLVVIISILTFFIYTTRDSSPSDKVTNTLDSENNATIDELAFKYLHQSFAPDGEECTALGKKVKEQLKNKTLKLPQVTFRDKTSFKTIGLYYLFICANNEEMPDKAYLYLKSIISTHGFREINDDPYHCAVNIFATATKIESINDLILFYQKLISGSKDTEITFDSTLALINIYTYQNGSNTSPPNKVAAQNKKQLPENNTNKSKALNDSYLLCKKLLSKDLDQNQLSLLVPVYFNTLWYLNNEKYKSEGVKFFNKSIKKRELEPDLEIVLYHHVSILMIHQEKNATYSISKEDKLKALNYAMKAFTLSKRVSSPFLAETTINLARSYLTLDKNQMAFQTCKNIVKAHPEFREQASFIFNYGQILMRLKKYNESISLLSSFLKNFQKNYETMAFVPMDLLNNIHNLIQKCKQQQRDNHTIENLGVTNLIDLNTFTGE